MKQTTVISTKTTKQYGTINLPSGIELIANPVKMLTGETTTQFLIKINKNIADIPSLINSGAIMDYLRDHVFKCKTLRICRMVNVPFIEVNGEFSTDWDMKSFGIEGYNKWTIYYHKNELIPLKSREHALLVINEIFPK